MSTLSEQEFCKTLNLKRIKKRANRKVDIGVLTDSPIPDILTQEGGAL